MKLGLITNVFVNYSTLGLMEFVCNAEQMLTLMVRNVFASDYLKEMDSNAYKLIKRKHLCLRCQDPWLELLAIQGIVVVEIPMIIFICLIIN